MSRDPRNSDMAGGSDELPRAFGAPTHDSRRHLIENALHLSNEAGTDWGENAFLTREQATMAIEAILDMAASHSTEIAGIYAQQRVCAAIGLRAFTFSADEAAAIEAHRKAGNLRPGGPFKSTIEAVRDRDLVQQVGITLQGIFRQLNDADLVVTKQARQAGITTDLHRLRIALDALRLLSKRIEVLPFIDREP